MGPFKDLLPRLAAGTRGMTVSQKAAILLSGLLAVGSLAWLGQWAASPEMVPLLDQELQPEELARIRSGLEAMNEPFKVNGGQIQVRAVSNRAAILAQLQQQDKLPSSTSSGFDAMVKESNPWLSQEENDRRWTVALKHEIEGVLRMFNGVRHAEVFLNLNPRSRSFSRSEAPATASVTLIMKSGEPVPRSLAVAAAKLVSGAVRGLPLHNVQVVDAGGNNALDWEDDSGPSGALTRLEHEHERRIADKIRGQLAFDPKVRVSVHVELERTSSDVQTSTPTNPVPVREESDTSRRSRAGRAATPSVEPNTAVTASSGVDGSIEERETRTTESVTGTKRESTVTPSGAIKSVFAAVNVSHSYLENVLRRQNPDATSITEDQIKNLFESEKPRIVGQVAMLVRPVAGMNPEDQIRVDWYYDAAQTDAPAEAASSLDSGMAMLKNYGPQAGLGILALVSFALMFGMARKSDAGESFGLELGLPSEAIEAARKAARDVSSVAEAAASAGPRGRTAAAARAGSSAAVPYVDSGEPLPVREIGETMITDGVLVGREVDDSVVQIKTMLDQITNMTDADPAGVSSLLERWVTTDH